MSNDYRTRIEQIKQIKADFSFYYPLMLRSLSWERRHPCRLPPEMAALPVRNISYPYKSA